MKFAIGLVKIPRGLRLQFVGRYNLPAVEQKHIHNVRENIVM